MLDTHLRRLSACGRQLDERLAEFATLSPNSAAQLRRLQSNLRSWNASYEEYVRLANAGKYDQGHDLVTNRMLPILKETTSAALELENSALAEMAEADRQGNETVERTRRFAIGLVAICLIGGAGILRNVTRSTFLLKKLTQRLFQTAGRLSSVGAEVAASGAELEEGAGAQVESLREAAEHSRHVRELTSTTVTDAREAQKRMGHATVQSDSASQALVTLSSSMQELDRSTRQITGILRTINEIAFQTNLLALNASVEAARAGQAGLGFAVVANEIRTLASRCSEAATETAALVGDVQRHSNDVRDKLGSAAQIFQEITAGTGSVQSVLERIASSLESQSAETARANQVILGAAGVTNRNLQLAERGRDEARAVERATQELDRVVFEVGQLVGSAAPAG